MMMPTSVAPHFADEDEHSARNKIYCSHKASKMIYDHIQFYSSARAQARTNSGTHARNHARAHTHAHMHARTHARKHTHTHTLGERERNAEGGGGGGGEAAERQYGLKQREWGDRDREET